jgi:hypothetical protein
MARAGTASLTLTLSEAKARHNHHKRPLQLLAQFLDLALIRDSSFPVSTIHACMTQQECRVLLDQELARNLLLD